MTAQRPSSHWAPTPLHHPTRKICYLPCHRPRTLYCGHSGGFQPLVAKISKTNKVELEACGAGHILRRPWVVRGKLQTYNLSLPLHLVTMEILNMSVIFSEPQCVYLLDENDNTSLTCKRVKVLKRFQTAIQIQYYLFFYYIRKTKQKCVL